MTFKYGLPLLLLMSILALLYWKPSSPSHLTSPVLVHQHVKTEENFVKFTPEQIQAEQIKVLPARPQQLTLTLSTRGKIILKPDHFAHVIPKAAGIAREATKNIGSEVRTGEIMAILESQEVADLKASYLVALNKVKLSKATLEREDRLFSEKISSEQDFLNAKNIYEESVIQAQLAKQKLQAFGVDNEEIHHLSTEKDPDLHLYPIRSPINGTVVSRHITQGEFIENTKPIYEVADLKTVWVDIGVYPKDLSRIRKGQVTEVFLPTENRISTAQLVYVSPIVADETITAQAIAQLDNSEGIWRPGLFVKVNVITDKIPVKIAVLNDAIQSSEGKDFVFVAADGGFEKRFIQTGLKDDTYTEIRSGLQADELYAANKTFLIKAEMGKGLAEHEH